MLLLAPHIKLSNWQFQLKYKLPVVKAIYFESELINMT
jgi:hypothetical protein